MTLNIDEFALSPDAITWTVDGTELNLGPYNPTLFFDAEGSYVTLGNATGRMASFVASGTVASFLSTGVYAASMGATGHATSYSASGSLTSYQAVGVLDGD